MPGRNIWINYEAPQQYIHYINPWKKFSDLMQFLKYLAEPVLRPLRPNDVREFQIQTVIVGVLEISYNQKSFPLNFLGNFWKFLGNCMLGVLFYFFPGNFLENVCLGMYPHQDDIIVSSHPRLGSKQ